MLFRVRYLLLCGAMLVFSLSITLALWKHERETALQHLKSELAFNLRETTSQIEQHLATYEQMLRGVDGFLLASGTQDAAAFRTYVDSLQLGADYSGIQGMALLANVDGRHAPVVALAQSADGGSDAGGYDALSEPLRRKALLRAAESGMASISAGLLSGAQAGGANRAQCVMYLPLYRKGAAHDTPAQRRQALTGWVAAYVRIGDLLASLYGERPHAIAISLYDNVNRSAGSLLYASGPLAAHATPLEASEYLSIRGTTWVVVVRANPDFSTLSNSDSSQIILVAGSLLSVLLALVCWQVLAAHGLAVTMAGRMTEELRHSEEQARHMARHDSLTGLPNRALFSDRIGQALLRARRENTRLALMFVDLDNFKPVNDAYGHATGDALLQAVAQRLSGAVRASDTVGRIGGDEFVVLLCDIDSDASARHVGSKILESIAQAFTIGPYTVSISASIGVATYPEHGDNELSLSRAADTAMYAAKSQHKNCLSWAAARLGAADAPSA